MDKIYIFYGINYFDRVSRGSKREWVHIAMKSDFKRKRWKELRVAAYFVV